METRTCVVCGAPIARKVYQNPPERTACSKKCAVRISKNVDQKRIDDIVKMRLGGAKLREISEVFGVSRERVRQILQKAGVIVSAYEIKAEQVKTLVADGMNVREASDTIGVNAYAMYKRVPDDLREKSKVARFWKKVDIRGEDDCWEWKSTRFPSGYGHYGRYYSHRRAWELANNRKIPAGMVIMHSCDNPPCCNPKHLSLGTMADNIHDRDMKGRYKMPAYHYGENHPSAKLNDDKAREIFRLFQDGMSATELSQKFSVSQGTIYSITGGYAWRSVTGLPKRSRVTQPTGAQP